MEIKFNNVKLYENEKGHYVLYENLFYFLKKEIKISDQEHKWYICSPISIKSNNFIVSITQIEKCFKESKIQRYDIDMNQANINIGIIGHVAHGKTTLVKSITKRNTIRFKEEMQRSITIKLGYANAKIYENIDPKIPGTSPMYTSLGSSGPNTFTNEHGLWHIKKHISFVDCPGHEVLMATMISGSTIMNSVILLIAANEKCPQPQTIEHLETIKIMSIKNKSIKNIIIAQNKIDIVSRKQALENYNDIKKFIKGSIAENAPIIPISSSLGKNIDLICEHIVKYIHEPIQEKEHEPIQEPIQEQNQVQEQIQNIRTSMMIIRSFDINKPGVFIKDLQGGVIGGSVLNGSFKIGDIIEIRPGIIKTVGDIIHCIPLKSKIINLKTEENDLNEATSGGLIGIGTKLDPSLTAKNRLVGHIIGLSGSLPDIYDYIYVSYDMIDNHILKKKDIITVNIGSNCSQGQVKSIDKTHIKLLLSKPVCVPLQTVITISQKIRDHWRLTGHGLIVDGDKKNILIDLKI